MAPVRRRAALVRRGVPARTGIPPRTAVPPRLRVLAGFPAPHVLTGLPVPRVRAGRPIPLADRVPSCVAVPRRSGIPARVRAPRRTSVPVRSLGHARLSVPAPAAPRALLCRRTPRRPRAIVAATGRARRLLARASLCGLVGLDVGTPQRGPDPVRVIRVWRRDTDARPRPGHRGRAGARGPDREAGIGSGLEPQAPPPFLPFRHVAVAGPDVGGQYGQARQGGPVLGFLEDVAGVMRTGREFIKPQRGRVAQRTQVGKEPFFIVGLAGRPHSPRLQLGTFPLDTLKPGRLPAPAPHHLGLRGRVQRQQPRCRRYRAFRIKCLSSGPAPHAESFIRFVLPCRTAPATPRRTRVHRPAAPRSRPRHRRAAGHGTGAQQAMVPVPDRPAPKLRANRRGAQRTTRAPPAPPSADLCRLWPRSRPCPTASMPHRHGPDRLGVTLMWLRIPVQVQA